MIISFKVSSKVCISLVKLMINASTLYAGTLWSNPYQLKLYFKTVVLSISYILAKCQATSVVKYREKGLSTVCLECENSLAKYVQSNIAYVCV